MNSLTASPFFNKNKTISYSGKGISHKDSKNQTKNSFHTSSAFSLPLINQSPGHQDFFNKRISDDSLKIKGISLKKDLNRLVLDIQELKLSNSKLEIEKDKTLDLLDTAIKDSKTTDYPIELAQDSKQEQIAGSKEFYTKLKTANSIASLRNQIVNYQRVIREKEEEITALQHESKVIALLDKNKLLLETGAKTKTGDMSNTNMINALEEKEKSHKEVHDTMEYYKTLFIKLRNDNESLINKDRELFLLTEDLQAKLNQEMEKEHNRKYQVNKLIQMEKALDAEMKDYKKLFETIPILKEEKNKNSDKMKQNTKHINDLKNESKDQDKQMLKIKEESNKVGDMIDDNEQKKGMKKRGEINSIEQMKKENTLLSNELERIVNENKGISKEIHKIEKEIKSKGGEYQNYIEKKLAEYIEDNVNCFTKESTIINKAKKTKDMENEIQIEKDMEKEMQIEKDMEKEMQTEKDMEKEMQIEKDMEKEMQTEKDMEPVKEEQNEENNPNSLDKQTLGYDLKELQDKINKNREADKNMQDDDYQEKYDLEGDNEERNEGDEEKRSNREVKE